MVATKGVMFAEVHPGDEELAVTYISIEDNDRAEENTSGMRTENIFKIQG